MKFTPDDPKLTAYALGELPESERAVVEAELAKSPEGQQVLNEIRETIGVLQQELAAEPCPELTPAQERAIAVSVEPAAAKTVAFPWWKVIVYGGLSAAACLVLAGLLLPSLAKSKAKAQRIAQRLNAAQYANGNAPASPALAQGQVVAWADSDVTARVRKGDESVLTAIHSARPPFNTEAYDRVVDNAFLAVSQNPLSTFSIDVDTAAYANVRRFLNQGQLPPKDAVRIEELINYFTYTYPAPDRGEPFSVTVELAGCPWNPAHRLARIGLKGKEVAAAERPQSNLVFLIDVSGSMRPPNKLPLLKQALVLLVQQLNASDRVSLVVYAGASGLVLSATPGDHQETIREALGQLEAGGSTHGSAGIQLAYETAMKNFIKNGVNRVILCTDGDFNVGITSRGDLIRFIEAKAKSGVFLSVFGFGRGNYKDATLERLADKGNGNCGYIDTFAEARKLFVEQMSGTLITIAKDVKIQVEFNPAQASAYRLIGYENRLLRKEDFNDDTKDAGEIGAGHTVTALYEIVPVGQELKLPGVDPLKYQPATPPPVNASRELMTVKLRYKQPDGDTSQLLEVPVTDAGRSYAKASGDFKFAASVAAFGMVLRDSEYKGNATLGAVLELAEEGKGADAAGHRAEFLQLVREAQALMPVKPSPATPIAQRESHAPQLAPTPHIENTPPSNLAVQPTNPELAGNDIQVAQNPVPALQSNLAPLPIHMPMPTLKGTPDELPKGPHIEKIPERPPPPFLAPPGVKNVALHKPVTTSDRNPITGTAAQITDGDKEAFDDQVVEMRKNLQWVQVDLGQPFRIYAIALWHDHRWVQLYRDVVVQVADDPDFTQNVRTLFNNDYDNSAGLGLGTDKEYFETQYGKVVDAKGAVARYVRSYTRGSNLSALNCWAEIEVYALPADNASAASTQGSAPTNLAPVRMKLPMPTLK